MRESLKRSIKRGKVDFEAKDRKEWVLLHPAQVVATVSNIMWTAYT